MSIWHVMILAIVQGLAELLPVSSSAHVIVAAKLINENMSTPDNALLLVLLHTGTMVAVIAYFWHRWRREILSSWTTVYHYAKFIFVSCLLSGLIFLPTEKLVVHILSRPGHPVDIEILFRKLNWIAPALAIAGVLILIAGLREVRRPEASGEAEPTAESLDEGQAVRHAGTGGKTAVLAATKAQPRHGVRWTEAVVMGILQGFAIPFRGFSRSGATISGGLLTGGERAAVESYSFALAVALTPLAIIWELRRVYRTAHAAGAAVHWGPVLMPGLVGMVFAFLAGLVALKWLSRWLESGRWYVFGIYCLAAAGVIGYLYALGF